MFHFLLLLFAVIPSSAHRYKRSRYYCFFSRIGRRTRISASHTEFAIRNTFAIVNTTLTAVKPWYFWRTTGAFSFYLPNKAIVSSLKLTTRNRQGQKTTYLGKVYKNAQATWIYNRWWKNKAQVVRRWTNEQFARVMLKTSFRNPIVSVSIGWEYAIELELNQFRLYFPLHPAAAWSFSRTSVVGTVIEDLPINRFTVESPVMTSKGRFGTISTIEPTCNRVDANNVETPCSQAKDVKQVDVSLSFTYGSYKWWLMKQKGYRLPWWFYERQPRHCWKKKKSKHVSTSSSSEVRAGQNNLRKAIYGSSITHDLVFSVSYNHTLPTSLFDGISSPGTPPFYGSPVEFQPSWAWGSPNGTCWALGISASQFLFEFVAPFNIFGQYPATRRATFFLDDSSGVTTAYYNQVKDALIRVIKLGGTPRFTPFQPNVAQAGLLNDTRNFNQFRIVVLASDGTVKKFPSGMLFAHPNTVGPTGKTQLEEAVDFVNGLPDPNECKVKAQWTFTETKNTLINTMNEYVALAKSLPGNLGRNELSDIFIFSNSKPAFTGGNFRKQARIKLLEEVNAVQHALRLHTTRSYGQPMFAFGFGPNADFPLLDALTANNWGRVTMAFETDPSQTVVAQAESFFAGIGRVIASRITITKFTALYGFNTVFDPTVEVNTSISDAGYTIPILRDTDYIHLFAETPAEVNGSPVRSFLYNFDYIPGGQLQQANARVVFGNRTQHNIYMRNNPRFSAVQDKLNLSLIFDEPGVLCRYGSIIRVQTFEKALRSSESTTKTVAELKALIEAEGLKAGLQTSQTSYVVADAAQVFSTEGSDPQAYTANSNKAPIVNFLFGLITIVFGILFL